MKKFLLTLMLITFAFSINSQPVDPVRVTDCPAITEVPVMDGLMDESDWSPDQDMTRFSEADGDWDGEADFTSVFHIMWGWSYFYTFVKITDEVEHSWNGTDGNPWEFDNVEWFFQLDTQTVPTTYTDNTIQMRFNRGDAGFQSSTFRNGITEEDLLWFSENTPDGWAVECAIPWTNIMPDGSLPEDIHDWIEAGGTIGFDLSCADSDGDDPLVGARSTGTQTAWDEDGEPGDIADGTEDNAWNNTSVFGYLYMFFDEWPYAHSYHEDGMASIAFPNPATNYLTISEPFNYSHITIYSSAGTLILNDIITESHIDISCLKPGLYIAVFDDRDAVKFVKE